MLAVQHPQALTPLLPSVGEGGRTWRDVEEDLFRLVAAMSDGDFPDIDLLSNDDVRRLGYLAEVAALLLDALAEKDLMRLVNDARSRLSKVSAAIPLMSGAQPSRRFGLDQLAAEWGIDGGFDLTRYRAEAPALMAAGLGM